MSVFSRPRFLAWIVALTLALGFSAWTHLGRLQRVDYVSHLPGRAEVPDVVTPASATGYSNGQRELIVPEHNETSFAWIELTQQMFAQKQGRVRHRAGANAPAGHDVYWTFPYRGWLGLLAVVDHAVGDYPVGLSVERVSRFADPLLHVSFLLVVGIFVAWRFGSVAATFVAFAVVALFPFAGGFSAGAPDHRALARVCEILSLFILLAGLQAQQRRPSWFALAGALAGFGLWVDAGTAVPLVAGTVLGGIFAAALDWRAPARGSERLVSAAMWRSWTLTGAATVLAGYLIEFSPDFLGSWRLQVIHPLYGLAWVGAGELLACISGTDTLRTPGLSLQRRIRWIASIAVGVALLAAIPVAMRVSGSDPLFTRDALSFHLTGAPGAITALNTWNWLTRDGPSGSVVAVLSPFLLLVPAGLFLVRRSTERTTRLALALVAGPTLVALGCAFVQLSWWAVADGMLLVLLVAVVAGDPLVYSGRRYVMPLAALLLVLTPGIFQVLPGKRADSSLALTAPEAQELVERHLAHWLAKHSDEPGGIVYAPPHASAALGFFGGMRGIGTFAPENRAGFGVTLMIAAANTLEEAQALLEARGVRYVVLPSWDPFFDNFAELYLDKRFAGRTSLLAGQLRQLKLPVWLRPVSYQMPEISGFEGQSVLVFERVENQSPALAAGRLVEYLVETGNLDRARAAAEELRRFPGDVGALTARAQEASARDDAAAFGQAVELILERLGNGGDRFLSWDRRVGLTIVLAQAEKLAPAREQLQKCIADATTDRLRMLSTGALYKLLVLGHAMKLDFNDSNLASLALDLLPPELRERL